MTKTKKTAILTLLAILICSLLAGIAFALSGTTAYADASRPLVVRGITVGNGAKTVTAYSDPVEFTESVSGASLNDQGINFIPVGSDDSVIYTASYPKTTTGRTGNVTEFVCEAEKTNFKVTEINSSGNGSTYIPVGGFVLSVPSSNAGFAAVGDTITLGGTKINIADKAVESEAGNRIAVDNTNTNRSGNMIVYYDYQYGKKTGTNIYGTEMTCTYDFEENSFKVVAFRPFGTGDDAGSDIPDNSFVLSAYGTGYRGQLVEDELFGLGDKVKMVGFDFLRFGGTVTGAFDCINPTKESNPKGMETSDSPFPAYRGENQTIIYTYGWNYNGASGTGTNTYGYEAAVDENGVVVELNVNVSKIPENGYVISGHGLGRDFIRSNIVLGATVEYDVATKTYSAHTTLNSYYENLVLEANTAIKAAKEKIDRLYDVDGETINTLSAQVEDKLAELKTIKESIENNTGLTEESRLSMLMNYNNFQLEIENLYHRISTLALEGKAVAAHAVWHRPTERTYADIKGTVDVYADMGINLVFVETLYNGYSTFRTKYSDLFPYNVNLGSSYVSDGGTQYDDYLKAFTAACKEKGIEVHAWVENFYVGTQNSVPVVRDHPDWVMYNDPAAKEGYEYIQRNEGGPYIFIDPANKDACDALINYYKDLMESVPDIAGLNLDYIRYPVSNRGEDTGYTIAAMQGFAEQKGMTFTDAQKSDRKKMANKFSQLFDSRYRSQAEADKNYEDWVTYRTDIITAYVKRIKTEVKDEYDKILSTAVFSSISESLNNKKQDWKQWFTNGWIDIATPMAYYNASADVLTNVSVMIQAAGNNCYYYAGLASSYSGLPAYRNTDQIDAAYSAGANGYVIFCSTQIIGHEDVQQVLKEGANSKKAVLPHAATDKIIKAYFDDIISKAERIYIPKGGMNQTKFEALKSEFTKISAMETSGAANIQKIRSAINAMYEYGAISAYASGYSGQRITEELKELDGLLDTKISLELISSGEWDPEKTPSRPLVSDGTSKPSDTDGSGGASGGDTAGGGAKPQKPANDHLAIIISCSVIGSVVVLAAAAAIIIIVIRKNKNKNKNS